jgi:hypothetical protein
LHSNYHPARRSLILVVRTQNAKIGSVGYSFLVQSALRNFFSVLPPKQFSLCHRALRSIPHPTQFAGLPNSKVPFSPSSIVLGC